ncbi:MAG: hypothetical protein AMJ61_05795 [Desulfobacterales bacterium SG8_35_2]|nr:MAG: hypothetical protein AMJ61_05795 [Desulfobacterales bacterium SG8_35_2]
MPFDKGGKSDRNIWFSPDIYLQDSAANMKGRITHDPAFLICSFPLFYKDLPVLLILKQNGP